MPFPELLREAFNVGMLVEQENCGESCVHEILLAASPVETEK